MDVIKVEGGAELHGVVAVEGAKNSALKLMAATIMAPGVYHLTRMPDISDVRLMGKVLETLGATVTHGAHELTIDTTGVERWVTPYELVSQMRASITVLGPLLVRFGRAVVAMPGGCNIGARSIDQHLAGLEALGVTFENDHGDINACARRGLHGTMVTLDFPSVGATENVMMASVAAEGQTIIENAAREPEIVDLATMLNEMGADVHGAGTPIIEVHGVPQSELHACDHETVGDRIEAGTYLVAGALAAADKLTVTGFDPMHLDIPLRKMELMGIRVERSERAVTVYRPDELRATDIQTLPYPGFPTDMQAQFMVLATQAKGQSYITENVFENRFMLAAELSRMGASIRIEDRHALVDGPTHLTGAPVKAPDLRGGAALVLAGLVADGTTYVTQTHHIKRGYERLTEKLTSIGARCEHVDMPLIEE